MGKKIFISIASYRDTELYNTLSSALDAAWNPEDLHFAVLDQNVESERNFVNFVEEKGATIDYKLVHPRVARGPSWARSKIQQLFLNDSYQYFLQIDAHTRFIKNWDRLLVEDYEIARARYGEFIFTIYPNEWYYNHRMESRFIGVDHQVGTMCADFLPNWVAFFKSDGKPWHGDRSGCVQNWFCAGQAFGDTAHFLKVPMDEKMGVKCEEVTLSIRFHEAGIKMVCPWSYYLWHLYNGDPKTKESPYDIIPGWDPIEQKQAFEDHEKEYLERLNLFYRGKLDDGYGISNPDIILYWYNSAYWTKPEDVDLLKKQIEIWKSE